MVKISINKIYFLFNLILHSITILSARGNPILFKKRPFQDVRVQQPVSNLTNL